MGRYPVLKPREVLKILKSLGFREVRQKGSHKQFQHDDGRVTTVPFHKGRDISPILLRQIAKDINITIEEFVNVR
ncbi:MAG: type II toxin-antitoxin system HicA family toxin [Candidatus Marinimicrobia bacterium]|nr:type II toxin-antitoxin system HicA family toxin [Candidatus Neomarinimicrobiota bacterium]MCH7762104.1 type II toxin-antitoxin system HicA family toxin [Candidatus Neomarinimicrobiota bacterium]